MLSESSARAAGRTARLAAALALLHAGPIDPLRPLGSTAAAQEADESGRLSVIWEDPRAGRGTPRVRHFLSRDDGSLVALRVSENQLRTLGGDRKAAGRYVRVTGSWRSPSRAPGAAAPPLEVGSIRYAAAPAGASPAAQGAPIAGTYPWITVLCRFADSPTIEPHPLSWYEALMGSAEPGVDHYWRELSFDLANVAGSGAVGWYDLPQPRSAYVDDAAGSANLQLLKEDCAAVADADVQFPDFLGINFQFNEDIGGFSWGGSATLVIDGTAKDYLMTWLADWADHVTYTHEMGHGFGLPHSSGPYGEVYDSNWDVMSGSWTNHDSFWGWLAPHTISYHKDLLGWIPADRIYDATLGSSRSITLRRLADLGAGGDYLMARVPLPDGTYYTVETRRFVGYDTNLPAEAVILHHVTSRAFVVDPDDNGNPDDDGARWLPGETFDDPASGVSVTVDSQTADGFVVTISVAEPGHIVLDPPALAFAALQGTDPAPQTFSISNTGTGELQWTVTDGAPWLEVAPPSGTTPSSGFADATATVASTGLAPGSYVATITVIGSADNSPQTVAVSLDVTAAPVMTLVTEPLTLEAVVNVDPPVHPVVIRNDGGAELSWSASSDVPWMTFAGGSGTLAPGASETDTVAISVSGLAVGDYTGTLTFTGNSANSPQMLDAVLLVTLSPSIGLSGTPRFEVYEGDPPSSGELSLSNDGDGTLLWTASADSSWLTVSPSSGSLASGSGATLAVEADASALAPGTRTAVVTVAGNADDSPQTAELELTVKARPALVVTDVADHLMGVRSVLGAPELEYLDHVGNRNGTFDVGDFRAWLQAEGLMSLTGPGTAGGEEVTP